MIRTGVSSNAAVTNGAGLERVIEAAAGHGFGFVELSMEGPQTRETLESDAGRIRGLLEEHGLGCVVHLPWVRMEVGSPFPEVRDAWHTVLEQSLETADRLGAEKAVVHGTNTERDYHRKAEYVYDALDAVRATAASHDVELCAENVDATPMCVDEFPSLFEHTDVSMTLDTGHASVEGHDAASLAEFLSAHADRVSHLHLHDNDGDSDAHLPLGLGRLDFRRLLAPLRGSDWDGTLSIETATDPELAAIEFNRRKLEAAL